MRGPKQWQTEIEMLSEDQVAIVKGLLARGDKQHDIAAFIGCNGGRVAEIKTGAKHAGVKPVAKRVLPTPAEVASGWAIFAARQALLRARLGIDAALAHLSEQEAERDKTPDKAAQHA
jgi:hypothetical protein